LSGDTIDVQTFEGEPVRDHTFLLLINAHHEPIQFVLPGQERVAWQLLLDTASEEGFCKEPKDFISGDEVEIQKRATLLLKLTTGSTAQARHESWKKRQFAVPHDGPTQRERKTTEDSPSPEAAEKKSASPAPAEE